MPTQNKHTALPWKIDSNYSCDIQDEEGVDVATTAISKKAGELPSKPRDLLRPVRENSANAEFITRCCNSHYDLVEALQCIKHITNEIGNDAEQAHEMGQIAIEALAKATGKEVA